jgi:hypothetical protein
MNSVTSVIKRYPLATFFILTYIFSWWGWLVGLGQIPIGPVVAALIVVPLTEGKAGLKEWASRIVRWRVGVRWYAIALLLPMALAVVAVALNVLMGARALTFAHLSEPMDLLIEIFLVAGLARLCPAAAARGPLGAVGHPHPGGLRRDLARAALPDRRQPLVEYSHHRSRLYLSNLGVQQHAGQRVDRHVSAHLSKYRPADLRPHVLRSGFNEIFLAADRSVYRGRHRRGHPRRAGPPVPPTGGPVGGHGLVGSTSTAGVATTKLGS